MPFISLVCICVKRRKFPENNNRVNAAQCLHILSWKKNCICSVYLAASSVLLDLQQLFYMLLTSKTLNQSSKYGTLLLNQVINYMSLCLDSLIGTENMFCCLNVLTRFPFLLCCGLGCGACPDLLLRAALWEDAYDRICWDLLFNGFSYCTFSSFFLSHFFSYISLSLLLSKCLCLSSMLGYEC